MRYINKDYANRQIHLGLVVNCKNGEPYGLLYGENKYFYFEKKLMLEFRKTPLSLICPMITRKKIQK